MFGFLLSLCDFFKKFCLSKNLKVKKNLKIETLKVNWTAGTAQLQHAMNAAVFQPSTSERSLQIL